MAYSTRDAAGQAQKRRAGVPDSKLAEKVGDELQTIYKTAKDNTATAGVTADYGKLAREAPKKGTSDRISKSDALASEGRKTSSLNYTTKKREAGASLVKMMSSYGHKMEDK